MGLGEELITEREPMKKLENNRILITGGAGFIGSNLVEKFLLQGNEVVVLDNFSTGKRENLAPFAGNKAFTLIEGDIRNMSDCQKALDGVEYVLHEAALGSVPRSIKDPMTSTEVNITGFVNMLYAASQAKVKRFVYAASSSTYGDSTVLPKREDVIGKPLSPYAITKYVNELYAENFHNLYGIDTIGLRYFNVFGRRQDPHGAYAAVIPKFVINLLRHEPVKINGDGSYSRDFTYVDNVLQANELALLCENPQGVNTRYNTACGRRTTLNELFEYLKNELALFDPAVAEARAIHGPERSGDIPHSLADISKAGELLGYKPTHTVQMGLHECCKWYAENLEI